MSYAGKYALAKHETLALKCEALERQLEEAREEKKNLEKLVDDFDGAVRYIMVVAPQLDSIMKRNIGRIKKLKEQGL